jgi:NAD(P)-dependent dehydrogenase (short-subunit alcohol dehydrogenase family)
MSMNDFDDRTVVITGAAGHLGRAVATAFAERGANLVLVDRTRENLQKTFGGEDERRLFVPTDLLEQREVDAAVAEALLRFEHLDVLCNLAGGFRMGEAVHETSDATWNFLFDLNTRTLLHACRAVVPHLLARGRGSIVNVGAFSALKGAANTGAYVASKAAVIRLTESMSLELRERGINVNCVLPTTLDTPVNRSAMPQADPSRWVATEDLAAVIVFLASPAARAVHGAAVPVTGLG